MKAPLLSIVIPAHNEERELAACLASLNKQSYKNFEVIIVDDGSTDSTISIAGKFKARILKQGHQGPGAARNKGAKSAKGSILIFVDADMTFHKNYLKNLISPLIKDKSIIGTCHNYEVVVNNTNIWSRCWGRIRVSPKTAGNVKIFRAIRKKDFLKLGGFDSKYGYADDQTLWFKHKIRSLPALGTICYHKNPETLHGVYNQSRWIGASIDNFLLSLPVIRYLIPPILFILSPIAILLLSLKRTINLHALPIFPFIVIFMFTRYFGTLEGIIRNVYLSSNVR